MKKIATLALALLAFSAVAAFAAGPGPFYAKGDYFAGLNGLWGTGSAANELSFAGGVWSASVTSDQPGGQHWFKVTTDDWSENYGWNGNNVQIFTSGPGDVVHITLDTNTYSDGYVPTTNIVWSDRCIPAGSTFEVIGDAPETGAWGSGVAAALISDVWTVTLPIATPGTYQFKFRVTGTWSVLNMGLQQGDAGSANVPYTTTAAGEQVKFEFNTLTGRVRAATVQATPTHNKSFGALKAEYR